MKKKLASPKIAVALNIDTMRLAIHGGSLVDPRLTMNRYPARPMMPPEAPTDGAGMMVISVMAIGIFSAYMLYDLKRVIDGGETNYISATLALYLDIFNVFQSLLVLLGVMGGDSD